MTLSAHVDNFMFSLLSSACPARWNTRRFLPALHAGCPILCAPAVHGVFHCFCQCPERTSPRHACPHRSSHQLQLRFPFIQSAVLIFSVPLFLDSVCVERLPRNPLRSHTNEDPGVSVPRPLSVSLKISQGRMTSVFLFTPSPSPTLIVTSVLYSHPEFRAVLFAKERHISLTRCISKSCSRQLFVGNRCRDSRTLPLASDAACTTF